MRDYIPLVSIDVLREYSGWEVGEASAAILNRIIDHYNTYIVTPHNEEVKDDSRKMEEASRESV